MSEFKLYDRMINGDLRPHLEAYSDEEGLKALERSLFSVEMEVTADLPENLLQHFPSFAATLKDGDNVEIVIDQDGDKPHITIAPLPNEAEDDLIDPDIPPPPDAKAALFLDIVTLEYDRLKRAIVKQFELATDTQAISFYATRNIQLAKRIARDAFLLKKKLQLHDQDDWENPNTYIIEVVKKHLVYLIMELQQLFHPVNQSPVQSEAELEDELFDGQHMLRQEGVRQLSKQLDAMMLKKMYEPFGERPSLYQKRDVLLAKLNDISWINRHGHNLRKLFKGELGRVLAEMYMADLSAPQVGGLLEKYQQGLQLVTGLRLDSSSISGRALARTDFFEKAQVQLDAWKELIRVSYSAPVRENILKDLINTLVTIQTRKQLQLSEDQWNDYISDLLRAQKYYVADQSRSGSSGGRSLRRQSGELDITIRDAANNGNIKTIIETMKLSSCGKDNVIIGQHLNKLLNRYDTAGNAESFLIVLSDARHFERNWEAYQAYLGTHEDGENMVLQELDSEPKRSEMRVGYSTINRSGKVLRLYHLFLNMHVLPGR